MGRITSALKSYFATGILVIVPLLVTAWLIASIVNWVDQVFAVNRWSPVVVPGVGLLLAFAAILLAGFLGRNVIGSWFVANLSELLKHVPVVGSVYGALRQALQALFSSSGKKFGKAVLIEYPRQGIWTIAFVTSESTEAHIQSASGKTLISVYVPTTPNPTSGFLLFVEPEQVRPLKMKVEDALKLVVSLGLVEASEQIEATENGN